MPCAGCGNADAPGYDLSLLRGDLPLLGGSVALCRRCFLTLQTNGLTTALLSFFRKNQPQPSPPGFLPSSPEGKEIERAGRDLAGKMVVVGGDTVHVFVRPCASVGFRMTDHEGACALGWFVESSIAGAYERIMKRVSPEDPGGPR